MDRPRQISRVIDHMLSTWDGHATIDPARIGMFGFSSGGFTALVSIGGIPDFSTVGPMCRQYPGDFACQLIAKSGGTPATPLPSAIAGAADPRIKAAVVAAPALGFTFSPDGLKNVKVPVQLWRADNDAIVPHPRYAEAVRLALAAGARLSRRSQCRTFRFSGALQQRAGVDRARHLHQCRRLRSGGVSRELRRSGRELLQQDTVSRVEKLMSKARADQPGEVFSLKGTGYAPVPSGHGVSTSKPSGVTATMCSHCADSEWSRVTTVQPSGSSPCFAACRR